MVTNEPQYVHVNSYLKFRTRGSVFETSNQHSEYSDHGLYVSVKHDFVMYTGWIYLHQLILKVLCVDKERLMVRLKSMNCLFQQSDINFTVSH